MTDPATVAEKDSTPRLLARLGRAQLEEMARDVARAIGVRRPSRLALDAVPTPDTATAAAAAGLCADSVPPTLVNHSRRTYAFGALLGARDRLEWDAELLYVEAMLHDIGLGRDGHGDAPFEQEGAALAREFARDQGWDSERADLAARAIAMHMDVAAARERAEIALLHLGAAADVIGSRLGDLAPATVAEVVERYPREGFKAFFADAIRAQADLHPGSAADRLCRYGQFIGRIKRAPFDE